MIDPPSSSEIDAASALLPASEVFAILNDAFRSATGSNLVWSAEPPPSPSGTPEQAAEFCREYCHVCKSSLDRAKRNVAFTASMFCQSFAALHARRAKISIYRTISGWLAVDTVFTRLPEPTHFARLMACLSRQCLSTREIILLENSHAMKSQGDPGWHLAAGELLDSFAVALGDYGMRGLQCKPKKRESFETACRAIDASMTSGCPVAKIASESGLRQERLNELFQDLTGLSPLDFINRRRVEYFKKLLTSSNERLSILAEKSGWASLSQFNRTFANHTGKAPREYLKEEIARKALRAHPPR